MSDSHGGTFSRQRLYIAAAIVSLAVVAVLVTPGRERLSAAGPANTGHEELTCVQCHTGSAGTPRQQVQANVRNLLGLRETGAPFLHQPVVNEDCLACHQNNEDRHPVYRFNEPRFAEVREEIAPQNCVSCHAEHSGRRVTADVAICSSCHADMEMKNDPAEPTHATLLVLEEWGSCLRCHDFHGNHIRTTPTTIEGATSESAVLRYLAGGPSIYGTDLRFPAKTDRESQ